MQISFGLKFSSLLGKPQVKRTQGEGAMTAFSGFYRQATRPRKVFMILAVFLALVFYWFFVDWTLASKRGFEFTDEALYLLAAKDIGGSSSWGFPWGWHTAPFYALTGGDIAAFRTIGGYLLTITGGVLGTSAYISVISHRALSKISRTQHTLNLVVFALIGVASTFFYYAGLLRAPSYNWVNLMGLMLAMTGGLLLIRGDNENSFHKRILFVGLASWGMVFAAVGKPSSPIFILIVLIAVWVILVGAKRAVVYVFGVAVFGVVYITLLVLLRLWPSDFFWIFLGATQAPSLVAGQGIGGALTRLMNLPTDFLTALLDTGSVPLGLLLAALSLWSISLFRINRKRVIRFMAVCLTITSATWVFVLDRWSVNDLSAQDWFVSIDTTMTWFIIMFIALISFFTSGAEMRQVRNSFSDRRKIIVVALALVSMPFIFGFGSGHELLGQASLASVGFAVAIMVLFVSDENARSRAWLMSSFAALVMFMTLVMLVDSYRNPYRMAPISTQVHEVELSDKGRSTLLVDDQSRNRIEDYLRFADEGGIVPGDPLLGLVWRWNADVSYILDSTAPPGLMVTLFGYEGSTNLGKWKLGQKNSSFDWSRAWIVVTETEQLQPEQFDQVRALLDIVGEKSGLTFPKDYRLVGSSGGVEFYSPR
jgi:hypothetical protein